jgi:hypothetical protein
MPSSQRSNDSRRRNHRNNVSQLDVTRQASMADEGGTSAALMEIEDDVERRRVGKALSGGSRRSQTRLIVALGIGVASVALGAWAVYALTPNRSRWRI